MLQELQLNVYIQLQAEKLSTTQIAGSLRMKIVAVGHKLLFKWSLLKEPFCFVDFIRRHLRCRFQTHPPSPYHRQLVLAYHQCRPHHLWCRQERLRYCTFWRISLPSLLEFLPMTALPINFEDHVFRSRFLLSCRSKFKGASHHPGKVLLPNVVLEWFVEAFVQRLLDWSQATRHYYHVELTLLQVCFHGLLPMCSKRIRNKQRLFIVRIPRQTDSYPFFHTWNQWQNTQVKNTLTIPKISYQTLK